MIRLKLTGTLYQKGNGRRIVMSKAGKVRSIKSTNAMKCFDDFILQAKAQYKGEPLEGKTWFRATIYYPNNRHDLDDSLLCDILQASGVIKNDRSIVYKELAKNIDRKNPRVEIEIGDFDRMSLDY